MTTIAKWCAEDSGKKAPARASYQTQDNVNEDIDFDALEKRLVYDKIKRKE